MIPEKHIQEWAEFTPWRSKEYIEQDLIICRSLCELYKDEYLAEHLALRGGTTLNKLYLNSQPRYSEDIDLVQINTEPIKEAIERILSEYGTQTTRRGISRRHRNVVAP